MAAALQPIQWPGSVDVAAVGKAAAAMALGARRALGERVGETLVITKSGHLLPGLERAPGVELMEAGHPIPTPESLQAGARLLAWLQARAHNRRLLFLLSGGASSLIEAPAAGIDLEQLVRVNRWLLASGLDIGAVNAVRRRVSLIKGGNLLRVVDPSRVEVWLLSDVAGDDPAVIGSGPLFATVGATAVEASQPSWLTELLERIGPLPPVPTLSPQHRVLANLQTACAAAGAEARRLGLRASIDPVELDGEAELAGRSLARRLIGSPPGVYIWGGETTVRLPARPGRGGRNQHLALAAAVELEGRDDVVLLALGTDGSDGPTDDAGALVDGATLKRGLAADREARADLQQANAGAFLEASGDLITTGPTGTNVRDLVIGWKA